MRGRRRLIAALAVAGLCAPGLWLRTEITKTPPERIEVEWLSGEAATGAAGWRITGVWRYSTPPSLRFGGFSALLPVGGERLRAFSDRGFLFTFPEPESGETGEVQGRIAGLPFADPALYPLLWDIESATRGPDPASDYWVGYENTHAIHRFSFTTRPEGLRLLEDEVDWTPNSGLEAMVRLADGRFLAIPEGHDEALVWSGDPVEGGDAELIAFANPAPGYAVTDMAQLPDGRVLLLMRDLAWDLPPFASLIAIAAPPRADAAEPWSPEVALRFEGILPPENYEGLALRERADGKVDIWVISDDNLSVLQRTLLVKLVLDPSRAAP
jgi:hypothetical protein